MQILFKIPSKDKLSSNEELHSQVKAKRVSNIKTLAYNQGYELLPEEYKESVLERKKIIDSENNNKIIKGKLKRKITKKHKEIFESENPNQKFVKDNKKIQEEVDQEFNMLGLELEQKSSDLKLTYLFNKVNLTIRVGNPTSHLIDPPNFYPTVKPIIDGLTYAGYWEDDNFTYIKKVTFEYDEEKSDKGFYNFTLIIEETE